MAWNEPGGNGNGNNHDPWSGDNRGGDKRGGNRGGGGDQGPPDLDEALRKLQERLNSIFGKSGGGGSGSGSGGSGSGFVWVLLVVVALAWAAMGFYTVDQQERGVVLRLGKYYETVNPGLQWNPPLIDEVTKVNTTRVRTHDHRALMLTEDENIVDIDMTVQYLVIDPKAYRLNVRDPENSLAHAAESALRQVVGSSEMHSLLTEGREALAIAVQQRLQGYMQTYSTGLSISKINVKNAQAPTQVQDAFDDVIKAREDEQRVKNEAESYANGIVPEARGEAQRMLEEANAYREEVTARAEGETKRFLALLNEYQKAPGVTRERLYLDTMQSVYEKNPKVLVDVQGGNNMLYLPLDKLMEKSTERREATRSGQQLNDQSMRELTDRVVNELRQRQSTTTRREGR
ncbi:protease modulator HflK [Marinobacterium nitratireducens]|uniref:Protein HflK n=1 Tax=Marinobacterium nitratireducens TaxID=518897 RepID=A0A917ZLR9_9GAMM|nr:FtsH protease activity modulator HflK [Marinobacterium nitratireducens]GGO86022.1 protease modulator HflK [Marinobacterium nitratireducens]